MEVDRFGDLVAHIGVVLNFMLHGRQRSMNTGDESCAPYPQALGYEMQVDARSEIYAETFNMWRRGVSQPIEAFD